MNEFLKVVLKLSDSEIEEYKYAVAHGQTAFQSKVIERIIEAVASTPHFSLPEERNGRVTCNQFFRINREEMVLVSYPSDLIEEFKIEEVSPRDLRFMAEDKMNSAEYFASEGETIYEN